MAGNKELTSQVRKNIEKDMAKQAKTRNQNRFGAIKFILVSLVTCRLT